MERIPKGPPSRSDTMQNNSLLNPLGFTIANLPQAWQWCWSRSARFFGRRLMRY